MGKRRIDEDKVGGDGLTRRERVAKWVTDWQEEILECGTISCITFAFHLAEIEIGKQMKREVSRPMPGDAEFKCYSECCNPALKSTSSTSTSTRSRPCIGSDDEARPPHTATNVTERFQPPGHEHKAREKHQRPQVFFSSSDDEMASRPQLPARNVRRPQPPLRQDPKARKRQYQRPQVFISSSDEEVASRPHATPPGRGPKA